MLMFNLNYTVMKRKVIKKISGIRKNHNDVPWYGVVLASSVDTEKKIIHRSTVAFQDTKEEWDAIEEGGEYELD
jgi:hypothetical protein